MPLALWHCGIVVRMPEPTPSQFNQLKIKTFIMPITQETMFYVYSYNLHRNKMISQGIKPLTYTKFVRIINSLELLP
jgi:hypothetical protein